MAAVSDAAPSVPSPRRGDRSAGAAKYRICTVCLGNYCRSPMAEVILRAEVDGAGLSDQVTIESAGTGDWHLGGPMHRWASAELSRRGYDGSGHIARQIEPSWLADFDLLLAMDRRNLANLRAMAAGDPDTADDRIALLRSFDPAATPGAEVPDPYDGGPADFRETFEIVHAAARGLAGQLAELLRADTGPVRG